MLPIVIFINPTGGKGTQLATKVIQTPQTEKRDKEKAEGVDENILSGYKQKHQSFNHNK